MRELSYLSFVFRGNAALRQIERRHFQNHFVTRRQPAVLFTDFFPTVRQHLVPIRQRHPVKARRQQLNYFAFNFDGICSGHVIISGSPSVMRTVCSKWADSEPSCVTTVQPSFKIFTPGPPALTIGSIAKVMPGRNFWLHFASTKFGTCGSSCIVRPTPCP